MVGFCPPYRYGGFRGNVNKRNKQKGIGANSGKISQNIRKA
jgi:hypothetical protein